MHTRIDYNYTEKTPPPPPSDGHIHFNDYAGFSIHELEFELAFVKTQFINYQKF